MRGLSGWIPALAIMLGMVALAGCASQRAGDPGDAGAGLEIQTETQPHPPEGGAFVPLAADRWVPVHCGNSMRPAVEELAADFQELSGIGVRLNFGGSSELLSAIELGREGDVYICHDPYAERLDEKGLLGRSAVVGHLEPIIIVPPGNPHGIRSMRDLAEQDLRLALPDSRYATAGRLVEEKFRDMGLEDRVRTNVRMEARAHNDLALAVLHGHVDAGMVWNFIARFYKDRLEQVSPGAAFPETRVTVCLLKHARDREAAERFVALATSEHGREVFRRHGYTRSQE